MGEWIKQQGRRYYLIVQSSFDGFLLTESEYKKAKERARKMI